MAKPKLLFITYSYPPYKTPRSIQISHLTNALKKNYSIKILSIKSHDATDRSLLQFTELSNVHYITESSLTKFIRECRGDRLKNKLLPDHYFFSHFDFYNAARKMILEYQPEFIFTFGQPMSLHIAGLKLKKIFNTVKWIAHFSDPWVDNIYNDYNTWKRLLNTYYENLVFKTADKLVFTSSDTVELIQKRYGPELGSKCVVVPHCFNDSLFKISNSTTNKVTKFNIRYLGNFYGKRQPDNFLKALSNVPPNILEKLQIEFYCSNIKTTNDQIRNYDLNEIVKCLPPVAYLDSLELMRTASLLLIIDAPTEYSPFLPSKLVDYIGANRPIFGITPVGTSKNLIEEMGFPCSSPDDPESIATNLSTFIEIIERNQNLRIPESIRNRFIPKTIHDIIVTVLD